MEAIGLLVALEARPGKEVDAETFLKSAQSLALTENGTLKWYAIKLGPRKFGIFDTFASEDGRNAHLSGEIAKALGGTGQRTICNSPTDRKSGDSCKHALEELGASSSNRKPICLTRACSAENLHELTGLNVTSPGGL
jgi:hypothetical protein